jgi:predicted TPR repeat methyltransferase
MNRKERRAAQKQGAAASRPAQAAGGSGVDALVATAAKHFRAGQLAEAEQACRAALAAQADHFEALHLLGVIASRLGHREAALDLLGKAIAVNARDLQARLNLGLVYVALGRHEEAAAQFAHAGELDPACVPALIYLGNVRKEQGRLDDAAAQYRRALAVRPDAMAHYNLANVLALQGERGEAISHYRHALAFEPNAVQVLNNLGRVLDVDGRGDEALTIYRRALALAPDNADVHNSLGILFWQRGELDEAAVHYRQAVVLQPAFLDAYNNLSHVLKKQDRLAEAYACLQHAMAIDPNYESTQLNLCAALYQLDITDHAAATHEAGRLLAVHGERPLIRRGLAGLVDAGADVAHDSDYARALFDRFANTFDKTLTGLGYNPTPLAQALEIDLQTGARFDILDVGCGTGISGAVFKPVARTLTGVDLSRPMLEKARARAIYDRREHGDAVDFMGRNTDAFDLVVMADVLTYIGDVTRIVQGAHQALRGRGRVAASVESLDLEGQAEGYRAWPSGRYKHSRRYLEEAFAAAGFVVRKIIASDFRRDAGAMIGAWVIVAEKPGG